MKERTTVNLGRKNKLEKAVNSSLLLESRFKTMVKRGFVYFPLKHKQIEIDIPDEAKAILKQDTKKIR